jgi:regulator of sigma E protease
MDVLVTVATFVAVLFVLVLVHELGHFVTAKRAGITVQEFGIGFPPRIASLMWRGTRYSINWVPLGGFVKMLGEDGDAEIRKLAEQGLSAEELERAAAGAFNRKPIWVRVVVLTAGVAMNFILAVGLFAVWASLPPQTEFGPLTVTEIVEDSPADDALEVGDRIVSADGRTFERSRELTEYVRDRAGVFVDLGVVRDGEQLEVTVRPRPPEELAPGEGAVGFAWEPERYEVDPSFVVPTPLEAVARGTDVTVQIAVQLPGNIVQAVGGLLGLVEDAPPASGPIGIAEATGRVLGQPIAEQIAFLGLLSVNLAVLNILPFPPLDGGRILVTLIEAVRRRRMQAEREALIYLTGFAVLLALIILVSIRDVGRLIGA